MNSSNTKIEGFKDQKQGRLASCLFAQGFFSLTGIVCGLLAGIALWACPSPAHAEEAPKVVAKVNGVPITRTEVEVEINAVVSRTFYHRDVSREKRKALAKEALESLIEKELEYQEAKRQGIKASKEEIKEKLDEIKKNFPSEKEFKDALKIRNLTVKKYEELLGREITIAKIVRAEVDNKVRVGEGEMKAFYEKNMDKYRVPEEVKLRHIMLAFDPAKGAEDKERARKKAEELLKRAKGGEDFAALASEYSEDAYKAKGGDLGYVARGMMEPEMEKTAFSLRIGEIMGPVETEYGFYIIRVEDKKPERQLSFDEVKERVARELEGKKREERKAEWINSLTKKATIEYEKEGTGTNSEVQDPR